MGRSERSQAEDDIIQAWSLAANCLLYEGDGGPDINVGTETAPSMIEHAEAVQRAYAKYLLIAFDADLDRIRAAGQSSHQEARDNQQSRPSFAQESARAADLCERAAQIVLEAGAAGDDQARRRLLAISRYETNPLAALGGPDAAKQAERDLRAELAEIDSEPSLFDEVPDTVPFTGPTYDESTGRLRIGQGTGGEVAYWQLNTPGAGTHNGLILGPRGIGKTSVMRIVLAEAALQPKFALWLADPTNRHGFPGPFAKIADKAATTPRAVTALLRDAAQVVDRRRAKGTFPDPTAQRQGVLITLEDCHEAFADNLEATELAEHVAVNGGPVSVSIITTAPDAELIHYGGSLALRTALAQVNCLPMGPNALHMIKTLRKAP